ncbi:small nucleolar RNP protein [Pisolithus thermaeus]|nr:small nucleolar RNP protein [Pisolithus thermaeus]
MSRGYPRGAARGGRGFGRGGGPQGPPDTVLEVGSFLHAVEDEMFCASLIPDKVPYFNAPIYLQNKSAIGKVDEILGPINEVYFSIKMNEGMIATSFKKGDKVYIGSDKLLPIERFLPRPKVIGMAYQAIPGADWSRSRPPWAGQQCNARTSTGQGSWQRYAQHERRSPRGFQGQLRRSWRVEFTCEF